MRRSSSARRGLAVLMTLLAIPVAFGQVEKLDRAIDLYEQQRYQDADKLLKEVDRTTLSDAERAELDRMIDTLSRTLRGVEQAQQDFNAAEAAFNEQRWPTAESLYAAVIDNVHSPSNLRDAALQKRARARELMTSAAARPTGSGNVYEMEPVSPGAAPRPAPAPNAAREGTTVYNNPRPMQPVGATPASPPAQPAYTPPPARSAPLAMESAPVSTTPPAYAPPSARSGSAVDEMLARDELLWQRAVALLESLSTSAREAMAREDYDAARQLADQALAEIEAARAYAEPVEKYTTAREMAVSLKQEVEDAARGYDIVKAERQREEIQRLLGERTAAQEAQRLEKITQLFETARQLRRVQRFSEEAEIYRQVLYIDPANARAKDALEIAEDYASFMQQQDWHDQLGLQQRRALTNADEALIPWDYDVLYPRNWAEISARREAIGPGVTGQSLQDIELNKKLDDVLPEVRFEEQALEQVVDFLQETTDINFSVDWEDLESNGIERDRAVTLQLANLSIRTVLNEILTQVGGDVRLSFAIGDSLLRIATKEKLDRDKLVLVYDIRDLLVNIPRFDNAPLLDPAQALQGAQQAGQQQVGFGQGGGGGGGFGGGGGAGGQLFQGGQNQQQEDNFDPGALVERIMDIIRQTVETDSWRETGGGDASLRELNGQLIVYQTSDAHRQVQDLLSQLRETRALQIALEARYLSVTSNFLEEIGVDIDFVFNSGTAGFDRAFSAGGNAIIDPFTGAPVLVPRTFSQIGTFAAPPGFGTPFGAGGVPIQPYGQAAFVPPGGGPSPSFGNATPIGIGQNSIGLTNPGNLNTMVPGSLANLVSNNPGINIAGSFLDNLQVDFLVRATQANSRSSIVQAPRILMFNGQRANISVGRARSYVSSLIPVLAEGAVGFQPIIQVAQSGVVLDVEGTISADRRYVTVTVRTTQTEEPDLQRFEVQRQSGNSPGSFVTLIDQRFTSINTTASIPDGGTILLGGLKQVGEIEVEAGVPILSKIPILKRAFTNTTTVKDTRTLLILMKAKILIQREAEEEAFPTFAGN